MPKNKVKTVSVNKKVFMFILKEKNSSIRKLGSDDDIKFTEKTIRRALNTGEMRPELVKQIANKLDIDSSLLTGEMVKEAFTCKDRDKMYLYLDPLSHLQDFPYFREESRELTEIKSDGLFETGGFKETMKRILSLFDVSYKQYEKLNSDTKLQFEHDLYESMFPVIRKYFKENAYGDHDVTAFIRSLYELDELKERLKELEYADKELRKKFLDNPPKGLTKSDIEKMSSEDILEYEYALEAAEAYDPNDISPFPSIFEKYSDIMKKPKNKT